MARYTGPTTKIARKFGEPIFGADKDFEKRNYPPGQHGLAAKRKKSKEYGVQLKEKQKVKYMYGVLERQFHNTYDKASRMPGQKGENLVLLLESRLDNVVYRLGIAPSRAAARQLAQHCTYTELKTTPTHGFIGCERQTDVSLGAIANRVAKLSKVKFDLYAKNNYGRNLLDRQNLPYAIGRNVSVVFGQHMVTMEGENYRYLSTGASSYAGMVSQLPLDQSSTAQPIAINETTFLLTPSQLSTLTKLGIVTFKKSFTKGIVVTDGTTMAPVDSAFRRLAAWRVMGAVEDLIRAACDPFIGKPNHVTNRNSLNTAIKSRLEKIKGTLIEQYQFQLIVDPKMMKFSYIDINYNIVPIYEIREIRNHISIKDELDTVDVNVG